MPKRVRVPQHPELSTALGINIYVSTRTRLSLFFKFFFHTHNSRLSQDIATEARLTGPVNYTASILGGNTFNGKPDLGLQIPAMRVRIKDVGLSPLRPAIRYNKLLSQVGK